MNFHFRVTRLSSLIYSAIANLTGASFFFFQFFLLVQVMLLGARADDTIDDNMQVTIAFNHFGANLIERMPR
jgi:hypothetical protein